MTDNPAVEYDPDIEEPANEATAKIAKPKRKAPALVPVKLLRAYRPATKGFKVWTVEERDENGEPIKYGKRDPIGQDDTPSTFTNSHGKTFDTIDPATGEYAKVSAGRIIDVSKEEANRLLKLKAGEKPTEKY